MKQSADDDTINSVITIALQLRFSCYGDRVRVGSCRPRMIVRVKHEHVSPSATYSCIHARVQSYQFYADLRCLYTEPLNLAQLINDVTHVVD